MQTILPSYPPEKVVAIQAEINARSMDGFTVGVTGCDYPDIATALRDAPSGIRRFYLIDPRYRVSGLVIRRDAALIGFGSRDTVLEAAATPGEAGNGVITIEAGAHVFISGVTIRAGRVMDVPRRGGGVSNSGFLFMEDCAVIENQATYGVGVWTEGRLEMRHCVIAGNRSLRRPQPDEYMAVDCGGKGGGLRVEKDGYATLDDCLIAYNEATDAGGALHVSCEGTARLVNCTLYGNKAKARGGAVDSAGGELELVRCTVAGNTSGGKGQAIFHRGRLSLVGCLLSDNGSGKAYFLAADNGGEFGKGEFLRNEGNFDDTGSLPLAKIGSRLYVHLNRMSIRRDYGSDIRW
jgi:hypothetical protein